MTNTPTEPDQWQTDDNDPEYDPAPHGDGPTDLDTGDEYDDDGAVLDSLVSQHERDDDDAPIQTSAPLVLTDRTEREASPLTRLRTGYTTIPTNGEAYLVVPRNANRKRLQIRFYGDGGNIDVRLADDASKVNMRMGAFTIKPNLFATNSYQALDLDEHTGPVYVASTSSTPDNTMSFSFVEVTA